MPDCFQFDMMLNDTMQKLFLHVSAKCRTRLRGFQNIRSHPQASWGNVSAERVETVSQEGMAEMSRTPANFLFSARGVWLFSRSA
jgi:hypothetical protein